MSKPKAAASSSRARPPKPLKPGANPRKVLKNHKERGPVRYYYTIDDIAALSGKSRSTINRAIAKGLDLSSIRSVLWFLANKAPDPVENKPFSYYEVADVIGATLKQAVISNAASQAVTPDLGKPDPNCKHCSGTGTLDLSHRGFNLPKSWVTIKECLEHGFDPNVIRHSVESCRKQQLSPKVGGDPETTYFTHDVKPGSTSRVEPEERKPSLAERRAALKFREPSAEERLDALESNLNDVAGGFNKPEPCCAYAMGMEGGDMCEACRPR